MRTSRLRIWSRETGSAVPSRISLLISILRSGWIWCLRTGVLPSSAAASIYIFKTAIRHRVSPEFIGSPYAIAYRWRSLPRVCRHSASKPQGSSERVLPWQITMDQLICASLSHTHYRYEYPQSFITLVQSPNAQRIHAPVAQRYHITSDTLGCEFDPGKPDFSHCKKN